MKDLAQVKHVDSEEERAEHRTLRHAVFFWGWVGVCRYAGTEPGENCSGEVLEEEVGIRDQVELDRDGPSGGGQLKVRQTWSQKRLQLVSQSARLLLEQPPTSI